MTLEKNPDLWFACFNSYPPEIQILPWARARALDFWFVWSFPEGASVLPEPRITNLEGSMRNWGIVLTTLGAGARQKFSFGMYHLNFCTA